MRPRRPFVTIVSGVPRSGTSLLMRMLAHGGIPPLTDGERAPDAANPLGYYELEAVKRLPEGGAWLERASGRAVKVIHALLPRLPIGEGTPELRVLLLRRRLVDVVASQDTMLAGRGVAHDDLPADRLALVLAAQLDESLASVRGRPRLSVLEVGFEALLAEPLQVSDAVSRFLGGGLDVEAMARAVAPRRLRPVHGPGYTRDAMGVPLGPIELVVEHRTPGAEGGPTLRVRRRADERELLRFDCFARGGHWHRDPHGCDEVIGLPPHVESLEWTLAELRRDLPGYLAKADFVPVPSLDPEAIGEALREAERSLRQPPPALDDLDPEWLRQRGGEKWSVYPEDVLPLWVADMDFPVADPIRRCLQRHLDLGDLGYPMHPRPTELPAIFAERAARRLGWQVDPKRVELITDVVQGLYVALDRLTAPGEGALIQTPIYPPFLAAVRESGRVLVANPLRSEPDRLGVDLEDLRRTAAEARVLLLCNPHNPSGRAFSREELEGIAEVASAHDLWIVSDEIHADLVYPGARHVPIATLSPEVEARTLTLVSASKAFNVAGLRCAAAVFGSLELKRRFLGLPRHLRGGLGALGIAATAAAWRHGDPWLEQVLAYLEANRDFTLEFARRELPGVRVFRPEATYLAWLDCRELDLAPSPYEFFLREARVALSDGAVFGEPGRGFVRLNFATSRAILREALQRMAEALRTRAG